MTRRIGPRTKYVLCYTLVWGCLMAVWMGCFFVLGKMPIWKHDGLSQHWNVLTYYGEWLRRIAHNIFIEHRLEIPMWEMSIGAGGDILATFHYYTIGDPLNLLSVFVPARYTQWLYVFLIILRSYLCGLSFSAYCFYHKNRFDAVLLGSLIYAYGGYMLHFAVFHPYFENPMIYLPLLLIGIEKIYRRERPFLFIVMTAVSAMSNFYFFYMLCIFMFLYAAFCYFALFEKRSAGDVLRWFGRFVAYFAVGFSIALVLILPVLMTLFGTERFSAQNYVPILYGMKYYKRYLLQFIEASDRKYTLGFAALAITTCFYLAVKKRTRRQNYLLGGLVLLLALSMIPYWGHMINGMSYVSTNRWVWTVAMLIAYIFVDVYPDMIRMRKKELAGFLLLSGIYLAFCCYIANGSRKDTAAILLFAAAVLFVLVSCIFQKRMRAGLVTFAALLFVMANVSVNIFDRYFPGTADLGDFADFGKVAENAEDNQSETAVREIMDDSFWRYDEENPNEIRNTALHCGLNGVQAYYSLANPVISSFFSELWKNDAIEQIWTGLDRSSFLEKLFCVKYFAADEKHRAMVPPMFDRQIKEKNGFFVYEDGDALPLGYTYDSYIPRSDYEQMTAVQKRQALMQGAVLEESELPICSPEFSDRELDFEVTAKKDVKIIDDNKWKVTKKSGQILLKIPEPAKSGEVYLVFENLQYKGKPNRFKIRIKNSDMSTKFEFRTPKNHFYGGRHNFMINLGEGTLGSGKLKIFFEKKGTYSFDRLSLVVQPLDSLQEMSGKLAEDVMEDISVDGNHITGNITLDERKLLCISIPYSKGWKVRVNGEETETVPVNTAFTGLELAPGHYEIQMDYCTPYLKLGALFSLLGLLALLYLAVRWRGRDHG